MKRLALLSPLMFGLLLAPDALALSERTISTEQAQGNTGSIITLEVAPGYGLNINLIPTGEVVKKAWIDDPSQIALSFDGNLCPSTGEAECNNEGATVIHLRQINPIAFANLPRSPGGGTLLTLITEGANEGRKIYQFKVVPTRGQPKYTVLSISPDIEPQISPVLPPALPRQDLPMVETPSQSPDTVSQSQWQAQTPVRASQANNASNVVSSPPVVNSTPPQVDSQQVTPTPNQNTITPTDVVTAIPEAIAVPKITRSVTDEPPSQNAIAHYEQPLSDDSSTSASEQQTETNSHPRPLSNPSTPNRTNVVKMPTRITPPPTIVSSSSNSIKEANALVRGLVIARQKGQINHGTTTWKEVQSVVRLLRRGDSKQQATQEVGISLQLIERLIMWGQPSTVASY